MAAKLQCSHDFAGTKIVELPSLSFPMSDSLPPELINSILYHLCGTPSIAQCALVCRSWLPSARYHLLPPPKVLHLDQIQIMEFLDLIDSPLSTLSLISFRTLHLRQNTVIMDWDNPIAPEGDGYAWRNHTAIRDFLVRDLTFQPSITSLFLEWLDWRTLSPMALTSLHSRYTSVKELEFQWIEFTFHELCNLIAALTTLEKITIGEGAPFDSGPWTVDSVQMTHPCLCKLAFSNPPTPWMVLFFVRAIRYTAGIVEVSIRLPIYDGGIKACRELLELAGTSLQTLKLIAVYDRHPLSVDETVSFTELLTLRQNTNLQEIQLNRISEITLKLFLQGLKLNAKPNLRQLKLGLAHENQLEKWTGNWVLADEVLSGMLLKDPKLRVEIPSLRPGFWNGYAAVESTDPQELFAKLKSLLPRTAERWKLELECL